LVEGIGISIIVEPHLSGTYLDGAAMLDQDGSPVIGLTLRFDRIDSFWFTLLHELAHVMKHLSRPGDAFFDRLEDNEAVEAQELEANRIARDALVPRAAWRRSDILGAPSREKIADLARELKIHPAIIAGRLRRETKNYMAYSDLLGSHEVRKVFPTVSFT
jgi:HTH-type transcriptional regulator/antitoxin HigA